MKRKHTFPLLFRQTEPYDAQLIQEMQRLHYIFVGGRWCLVVGFWMVVGMASLWFLRHEFVMVRQHPTWAAVRYGLASNMLPTLGLSSCVGLTVGLLVWQSRNILIGLPPKEVSRLAQKVAYIREQGKSHPLWRYVCDRPSRCTDDSMSENNKKE
ncbi:MAG: hypothetical protein VKJ64_02345 [Leptolyngbyaceae bacterium]|nr:hypothetical protein [Leptolyngbyaceae bacterium]